jgi:hypothetical protein
MLLTIARMGWLTSSQLHRRYNAARTVSTTQRRLKRLADGGIVERMQFHRPDGGGVPMCYTIAEGGLRALERHGLTPAGPEQPDMTPPAIAADARGLRLARRAVHAAGWALALEQALGVADLTVWGRHMCAISPPRLSRAGDSNVCGPADLHLPGGRTPHEFLRSQPGGGRAEFERFETIRPDIAIALPQTNCDLLVELDDRLAQAGDWRAAAKLERYDHFVCGWSHLTRRYGERGERVPKVVFVCRDRARARACARRADRLLTACRAYAGEYPADWEYHGRDRILFAAERDVHEGIMGAYRVPRLPPDVRAASLREPAAAEPELLIAVLAPPVSST